MVAEYHGCAMHSRKSICFWTTVIALAATHALAQGVTVQQPTFSFSSTSTTVLVPDQGSTLMGGISRAESGRIETGVPMLPFRPFRNQSIGQTRNAANTFVTATIHDFDAMDQALLNSPSTGALTSSPRLRGDSPAAIAGRTLQPRTGNLAGQWQPKPAGEAAATPGMNLAAEQQRRAVQQETRIEEAAKFFERAQQAEADGKPKVARIYYQMAARRAVGDLKQQALAKLESLGGGSTKVAQTQP